MGTAVHKKHGVSGRTLGTCWDNATVDSCMLEVAGTMSSVMVGILQLAWILVKVVLFCGGRFIKSAPTGWPI